MSARILLVDDDRAALFALRELLADLDATLVLAATGEEALRQVLKQPFAAIMLDVRLPGMDGFEVAAAIRSLERLRRTPIIFMSAHSDRRRKARASALRECYLRKPLAPDVVRAKLAELVDEYRRAASEPMVQRPEPMVQRPVLSEGSAHEYDAKLA